MRSNLYLMICSYSPLLLNSVVTSIYLIHCSMYFADPQGKSVSADTPWKLAYNSPMTPETIMAAIVQTCGPITTHTVVARNYRFLNKLTSDQFVEAATCLETLALGSVVLLRRSAVFIKKPPNEVTAILESNPHLCSPEYYANRYNKALSRSVPLGIRHELSTKRLVPAKLMM